MSSPSQPWSSTTGTSSARSSCFTMGNCSCRDSSIGGRCALYCGSMSILTCGFPLSNAQITPSGEKDSTSLMNMLKKPKSALVARPSGAVMGWRIAWNARCMSELPSMTAMVLLGWSCVAAKVSAMGSPCRLWFVSIVAARPDANAAGAATARTPDTRPRPQGAPAPRRGR